MTGVLPLNYRVALKNVSRKMQFWILLGFVIRLVSITNPPLEAAHNWRQTTVTMVARNFLEINSNIFYPQIDFAGEKSGVTGMEFPLLNYLIYIVALIFGYEHWYGRLINLLISSIGIWYFYKLIKKYFDESIAFNASFLLIFSAWFAYSRKIMPDTFSMSLVLAGTYYGTQYLDKNANYKNLLFYCVFTLLGSLSKLPSGYLLIIPAALFLKSNLNNTKKILFLVATSAILIPLSAYYFYWVPYLTEHYGYYHFFMGTDILTGAKELLLEPGNLLEKFYLDALQIIGFLVFIIGLFLLIYKREKKILFIFCSGFLVFLVIMLKAGITFSHHGYYIIPFVPFMTLPAAFALQQIQNPKIVLAILISIVAESILNKKQDFFIKDDFKAITDLEKILDGLGKRDEKIAINSGFVPTPMYFAHRKGWITNNKQLLNMAYVNELKNNGLKYIVILNKTFGTGISLPYTVLLSNTDYTIYKP